jgi:lysylphosphatidylglycerol synthetase-like protein (DUF2156 family)
MIDSTTHGLNAAGTVLSIVAVAGAWVAGIAVLFCIYCFCFSTVKIKLLRYGLAWLLVTDIGTIVMLAALVGLFSSPTPAYPNGDNTTLLAFSIVGLVLLVALTVAAFVISRTALARVRVSDAFNQTRRRLEF